MAIKFLFTGTLSFVGASILSAQSTAALHTEQLGDVNTMNAISQLEQNALMALIGAVVLMGLMWICSVWKACAGLNQPRRNVRKSSINSLILIAGLSVFFGSCTVEQRAMAARYRIAAAAESRTCPCPHEYVNHANMSFNNRYSSTAYSNLYGPSFCRFCGKRLAYSR